MDDHNQDSMHWVMGGALLLIGGFVAIVLIMLNSQADTVSTSATVNNVSPTVVDVYVTTGADFTQSDNTGGLNGSISLNAGTTKAIKVTGTVEDLNGAGDIAEVSAVMYLSSTTAGCTADSNDCYPVTSCTTQAGATSDQYDFNCPISLAFWANSTETGGPDSTKDWIIQVTVKDASNATGSDSSVHKEISTLLALNIPASLDFGTLALNSSTTAGNNQAMTIEQYGNDEADVEVSMGSAMSCSVAGSIPVANIKWALSDVGWSNGAATALSGSAADTNLNVAYRTNDSTSQTQSLYWNISIPTSISGTCSSNMTITAIAH